MFWRKKRRPWYLPALAALAAVRIIYGFAKFFMKAADGMSARQERFYRGTVIKQKKKRR